MVGIKEATEKIKAGWGYSQLKSLKQNEENYLKSLRVTQSSATKKPSALEKLEKDESNLSKEVMQKEKAYQDKRTEHNKEVLRLEKVAAEARQLIEETTAKIQEYQAIAKINDKLAREMCALNLEIAASYKDLDRIRERIAALKNTVTIHVTSNKNGLKFTDDAGNPLGESNLGIIKEELIETGQFEEQSYQIIYYSAIIESIKRQKNCKYEDLKLISEDGTDLSAISSITDALSKINLAPP